MPTKQQFKDWKSQGPMKVGVFEKMNWQKGPEEPTDTMLLVDCRGCSDWSLDDLVKEAKKALGDSKDAVLDYDDCHLSDDGAQSLAKVLSGNKSVTELIVSDNNITEEGGNALAEVVSKTPMRRFDMSFNMLGDGGVDSLFRAFNSSTPLLHLNLRDNEIEVDGCEAIADALKSGVVPNLKSLNLRQNQILSDGCIAVCRALEDHGSIEALDLRENSIRVEGAEGIARLLGVSGSLTHLAICRNAIGNEGAKAIGVTLKRNKTLSELWMQDGHVDTEGGEDLASSMSGNSTLIRLDLRLNFIDMTIQRAIGQVCSKNRANRK